MIELIQELDFSNIPVAHSFIQQSLQWTIILKFTWTRNLIATSVHYQLTHRLIYSNILGEHTALDGIKYSWLPKMFWHRKKCQQCKLIKQKKETSAKKLAK